MITKADRIRNYFKENPKATILEASQALLIDKSTVKVQTWRDCKDGLASKTKDGIIYISDEEILEITRTKPKSKKETIVWDVVDIIKDDLIRTEDWTTKREQLKELRLFLGMVK